MTFEPVVLGNCAIYHGDCLQVMPELEAQSIDAIITDLPYGQTSCSWDSVIPFAPMWENVKRLLKPRGVFVTTASQPFTSMLVMSNLAWFRYEWIWDKVLPSGFQIAKYRPMLQHENVCVFCNGTPIYNPIMIKKTKPKKSTATPSQSNPLASYDGVIRIYNLSQPKTIISFSNADHTNILYPTQKPVALYEYLIRTYTNEGDTVMDIAAGSGTTAVACVNTNRKCILIEKEQKYVDVMVKRIQEAQMQLRLF